MTLEDERPADELIDAQVADLLTVVALIFKASGGKPGIGTIDCPVCLTGTIRYSVSSTKRAMAAKCSTTGCIAFLS